MVSGITIVFEEYLEPAAFTALIGNEYSQKNTGTKKENIVILDTFDGRLFRSGYVMRLSSAVIFIKNLVKNTTLRKVSWSKKIFPECADDFEDQQIRSFLSPVLGVRKLNACLQLEVQSRSFNLLNEDEKTVVRGTFVSAGPSVENDKPEKSICILKPLRGYSEDFKKIISQIPAFEEYTNFESALLGSYNVDLKDRSKPVFNFTPDMSVSEALKSILYQSFNVMRQNEQGILEDTDIEFLHDFRVSGRRMRSALSQIKGVFNDEKRNQLIAELKLIGKTSGPLRDLDVYLLREEEYISLLPDSWAVDEIHRIFETLKLNRHNAWKNMCALLQSGQYKKIVENWEHFFNNFSMYVIADPPVLNVARQLILKQYKKVISKCTNLSAKSPDDDFHRQRIMCKKLRYLMEFFSSLFDAEIMNAAIKQLKKIQDNLGNFNDLSVQIETLISLQDDQKNDVRAEFIQTVSGLVAVLNFKKQQLRNEFHGLFKEFATAESKLLNRI